MNIDQLKRFCMLPRWRIRVAERFKDGEGLRIYWEWCDEYGRSSEGQEVSNGQWRLFLDEFFGFGNEKFRIDWSHHEDEQSLQILREFAKAASPQKKAKRETYLVEGSVGYALDDLKGGEQRLITYDFEATEEEAREQGLYFLRALVREAITGPPSGKIFCYLMNPKLYRKVVACDYTEEEIPEAVAASRKTAEKHEKKRVI